MKKVNLLSLFILGILFQGNSQVPVSSTIDYNEVSAKVANNGVFFNDLNNFSSGYEIPKNEETHLIYSSAFWYGGILANSSLGLAAKTYGIEGRDFFPGPIADDYSSIDYQEKYASSMWSISEYEIYMFKNWWEACQGPSASATACENIAPEMMPSNSLLEKIHNWPAHGDVSNGESYYLAPFYDNPTGPNGVDGVYNYSHGDYPLIKGCSAIYMILNDDKGVHTESGGNNLGIEIHYLIYQNITNDDLNNSTIIDAKVFNRSNDTIKDFTVSFFMDGDLGFPMDDYFGTDPSRNLMYMYNADNYDENNSGVNGYLENPPAFGFKCLNHSISSSNLFSMNSDEEIATDVGFWNLMNGLNFDGTPILDNLNIETSFLYYESPTITNSFSEYQMGNISSDRRSIMSMKTGDLPPMILEGNDNSKTFSFVIAYSRTGDQIENVNSLFSTVDYIQNLYDSDNLACQANNSSLSEEYHSNIKVYPNPTSDKIYIETEEGEKEVVIKNLTGQNVMCINSSEKVTAINIENLETGIYLIFIKSAQGISKSCFVKN